MWRALEHSATQISQRVIWSDESERETEPISHILLSFETHRQLIFQANRLIGGEKQAQTINTIIHVKITYGTESEHSAHSERDCCTHERFTSHFPSEQNNVGPTHVGRTRSTKATNERPNKTGEEKKHNINDIT